MSKLSYNAFRDQMELWEESNAFETQFMVPPFMRDGDTLTPFMFRIFPRGVRFYFFGRYNEKKDMVEFVMAGPAGYKYKLSLADGNSPYGWKVKKHGVTRSKSSSTSLTDKFIGFCLDKFLVMVGKEPSKDYLRDIIQADAFALEEIIGMPMAIMRISHRSGVMDAREKCIGPWSFYGPSLPEAFCRCRLKVTVYRKTIVKKILEVVKGDDDESVIDEESEAAMLLKDGVTHVTIPPTSIHNTNVTGTANC